MCLKKAKDVSLSRFDLNQHAGMLYGLVPERGRLEKKKYFEFEM